MDRNPPSGAALRAATSLVVLALVALVALPLVTNARLEHYREATERHAEPAREALNELGYRLSQQIALLTRAVATGDMQFVERSRTLLAPQSEAMRSLEAHRGRLGRPYDVALTELARRMAEWHSSIERSVDANLLMFDANYPAVIEANHRLDEAITAFQSETRADVRRLARAEVVISIALVLLAIVAALLVLWIVARLRTLAVTLAEESEARLAALERERGLVRVRDEILGVVSHDLRSPLTTISLSTQMIPGSPPDEVGEHVETILTTTRRMQRLIQDLLDATKADNGALPIRRERIDPVAIGREVIASHGPIADAEGIALQGSIDEPLPAIVGDADRLAQALGNLIGNALKFTPEGGAVSVVVRHAEDRVVFEVRDTGPGIAESDLPHLFDPFWQAEKTAHLGAGLGLKITRAIVEAHGGTIEVRNAPAGGAWFSFAIPAGGAGE